MPDSSQGSRLFLLSPAKANGIRAQLLLNPRATFPLARQFHSEGLPISTVFAFSSGLYFRGKITYAEHFARNEKGDVIRVITSNAGLIDPATVIGPTELAAFGSTEIDVADSRYLKPVQRHAKALLRQMDLKTTALLLGSIATPKYRDVFLDMFGERLLFPQDFVGRGDMSRGALLLRAVKEDTPLTYISVLGATWTGKRARRKAEGKTTGSSTTN